MSTRRTPPFLFDRRALLKGALAWGSAHAVLRPATSRAAGQAETDATFVFSNDVHACRTGTGLSPHCAAQGKTDETFAPPHCGAQPDSRGSAGRTRSTARRPGSPRAGERSASRRGMVLGGDMTDDGGGQTALPEEGTQLLQFSQRYQKGEGTKRAFPSLCRPRQSRSRPGRPAAADRLVPPRDARLCRAQPSPASSSSRRAGRNYDVASDSYSWDWGGLHLVQCTASPATPTRAR